MYTIARHRGGSRADIIHEGRTRIRGVPRLLFDMVTGLCHTRVYGDPVGGHGHVASSGNLRGASRRPPYKVQVLDCSEHSCESHVHLCLGSYARTQVAMNGQLSYDDARTLVSYLLVPGAAG